MPSFFQFTQGTESRVRPQDSSPLLGRYRAVPPPRRSSIRGGNDNSNRRNGNQRRQRENQLGLLAEAAASRGSVHVGYGALVAAGLESDSSDSSGSSDDDDDDNDDDGPGRDRDLAGGTRRRTRWKKLWQRWVADIWIEPRQGAVRRLLDKWWRRYGVLVFLPALLAVAWCSLPFPQYPLPGYDDDDGPGDGDGDKDSAVNGPKVPGHGAARVQVNFWFFLFVYYGFYNLTALIWITKVFNLYSLNWWPQTLGFKLTVTLIAVLSLALPIPVYLFPESRFLTVHNTAWVSWTFMIMAIPVVVAFLILMTNERHVRLRNQLSDTQRIFTSSWWTGESETLSRRDWSPRRGTAAATLAEQLADDSLDPDVLQVVAAQRSRKLSTRRKSWLPASFVRFLWFCVALLIGMMAYLIGEAYAEIYLRTLPHNNFEPVVYVYGWVVTIHLLDALTGWVLGVREGERVGSYPLSWVFKLYFMLTYQTYVRALYARLRSPSQFVILQVLSSTSLVVITPLMMTKFFHRILTVLGMSGLSYGTYQKLHTRNVFIRFLAENASMATFLGSVLVLHFGANKDVYPYFAFDDGSEYDFRLTFIASSVTWACELVASLAVRGLISWFFGVDVGLEGKLDLAVWPELLPSCAAVMLHVLQNMLFSIVRLQFRG